jgi:hypothetical protein
VIGQQHPVVRFDVLADGLGQLHRRRRGVLGDRNAPERRHDLGKDGTGQRDAGHRKPRGRWRVRVHDSLRIRTLPIDLQVHLHLGRRPALPGKLPPVEIRDAHHVRRHEPLADAGRRHQQSAGIQADADVSIVRGRVAAGVQPASDFDDVGAELRFGGAHRRIQA